MEFNDIVFPHPKVSYSLAHPLLFQIPRDFNNIAENQGNFTECVSVYEKEIPTDQQSLKSLCGNYLIEILTPKIFEFDIFQIEIVNLK